MKCYDNWRAIYGMTCFTDQSGLEHREHTQTHTHIQLYIRPHFLGTYKRTS